MGDNRNSQNGVNDLLSAILGDIKAADEELKRTEQLRKRSQTARDNLSKSRPERRANASAPGRKPAAASSNSADGSSAPEKQQRSTAEKTADEMFNWNIFQDKKPEATPTDSAEFLEGLDSANSDQAVDRKPELIHFAEPDDEPEAIPEVRKADVVPIIMKDDDEQDEPADEEEPVIEEELQEDPEPVYEETIEETDEAYEESDGYEPAEPDDADDYESDESDDEFDDEEFDDYEDDEYEDDEYDDDDDYPAAPKRKAFGRILSIVHLICSAVVFVLLLLSRVLPLPAVGALAAGLAITWGIGVLLRAGKVKRFRFLIGSAFSIFMCAILVLSGFMLLRLNATLLSITGVDSQTATFAVYARADDPAESIDEVTDDLFGILSTQSRTQTNDVINQINKECSANIATYEWNDPSELANALLGSWCRTIIINESLMDVITETEGYEYFGDMVKKIGEFHSTSETRQTKEPTHASNIITMYITGIDTYGDIGTTSRSDVNILAVANTDTRQLLLVSTPRDYYVPLSISNGVPDKLTHAGIYGVDVSKDTLGMLYGIDMDYYFRINFSGFEAVIDALDGVTVWSDNDFSVGSHHFVKGYNTLNSEEALVFARERHSFADGDRQRGRDQMAVIQGVVQKMQTPAVLNNFNELLEGLRGSFQSDIPYNKITSVVKQQLEDPSTSWNVVQYSAEGFDSKNTTYSMNQMLYVMIPDEASVNTAKEMIQAVMNGETLPAQQ